MVFVDNQRKGAGTMSHFIHLGMMQNMVLPLLNGLERGINGINNARNMVF